MGVAQGAGVDLGLELVRQTPLQIAGQMMWSW